MAPAHSVEELRRLLAVQEKIEAEKQAAAEVDELTWEEQALAARRRALEEKRAAAAAGVVEEEKKEKSEVKVKKERMGKGEKTEKIEKGKGEMAEKGKGVKEERARARLRVYVPAGSKRLQSEEESSTDDGGVAVKRKAAGTR